MRNTNRTGDCRACKTKARSMKERQGKFGVSRRWQTWWWWRKDEAGLVPRD